MNDALTYDLSLSFPCYVHPPWVIFASKELNERLMHTSPTVLFEHNTSMEKLFVKLHAMFALAFETLRKEVTFTARLPPMVLTKMGEGFPR